MAKKSNGNGRSTREGAKLLARRTEAFRRWRAGESFAVIAKSVRLSKSTVALDCQLALREWRESHRGSVNETVELEWQLLNWIQVEAQRNWEMSQDPKQREFLGDPKYLDIVIRSGAERRKLLGVDKPARIESQTTVEVGKPTTRFLTIEELKARIIEHQQRLLARKAEWREANDPDVRVTSALSAT
jgi:hypothetical protein